MLIFLSMLDTETEKEKFSELYKNYRYLMWYVANEILGDAALAEDAVQEAFLTVIGHMNQIGAASSPQTKGYLVTITKSRAIDLLRKQKKLAEEEYDEALMEADLENVLDQYLNQENYECLLRAIKNLKEEYRTVLELRYLHERTEKEMAELLQVSGKVVSVRLFRARMKLKDNLEKEALKNE